MTNSFPKGKGDFSAFRTAAGQELLTQERNAATNEGRQILALEMIADQLGLIARYLGAGLVEPSAPLRESSQTGSGKAEIDGAESAERIPEGIERAWVETFAVGGYKYTDLKFAIEEAKRARKRPAANATGSVQT